MEYVHNNNNSQHNVNPIEIHRYIHTHGIQEESKKKSDKNVSFFRNGSISDFNFFLSKPNTYKYKVLS